MHWLNIPVRSTAPVDDHFVRSSVPGRTAEITPQIIWCMCGPSTRWSGLSPRPCQLLGTPLCGIWYLWDSMKHTTAVLLLTPSPHLSQHPTYSTSPLFSLAVWSVASRICFDCPLLWSEVNHGTSGKDAAPLQSWGKMQANAIYIHLMGY